MACFSNEFSTFSHKLVYVDFQVGDERALPGIDDHATGTKGKLHTFCMIKFSLKM